MASKPPLKSSTSLSSAIVMPKAPQQARRETADVDWSEAPTKTPTRKTYVPEGYESVEDYLQDCRKTFSDDMAYDRTNREAALEDLQFLAGDQWDPIVKASRKAQGRPCLTINVLPQFVGQVIGERRINSTAIKVTPRRNATVQEAETRSAIIKSIEAYSRADRVYDAACEDQVGCGIGNFEIVMQYADDDVFEQDLFVKQIPNPLAVVWDRTSVDITGRDARRCWKIDKMPRKEYEKTWKDAPAPTEMGDEGVADALSAGWFTQDDVRVVEHWRMIERRRLLAMMQDGEIEDVTDQDAGQYLDRVMVHPRTGQPVMRESYVHYAQMHLISGTAILEGPYELRLTRLPIIRVSGREIRVGDDRVRFGLTRFAKDSQRLKNYWRSVSAEVLALAPKQQWFGPAKAFEGYEEEFRNAHKSGDPILKYNDAVGPDQKPQRMDPPQQNGAVLAEAQMNQQDIKDTTGLQDASLGMRSNEISGRAIQARKQEGDVATIIYHDNLNAAIQEGGDVLNQLIPICYDTLRELRVIGVDDQAKLVTLNDPNSDESPNIGDGKYDVTLTTGPSYTTQREQAADAMMQAIQVAPQLMQIAGDLIVDAQDWPGHTQIAARLKQTIPDNLLTPDELKQRMEERQQEQAANPAAQQAQEQQQQAQQLQQAEIADQLQHAQGMRKLELEQEMAKSVKAQADAQAAQAQPAMIEAQTREANAKADKAERERDSVSVDQAHRHSLDRRGADHKENLERAKAAAAHSIAKDKAKNTAGPRPAADRSRAHKKETKK